MQDKHLFSLRFLKNEIAHVLYYNQFLKKILYYEREEVFVYL